jgi:type I restriction enzyme, S subunit
MTNAREIELGELMPQEGRSSVNPADYPSEIFELLSIPAYDRGSAEIALGSEIGSTKQAVQPGDVLLSKIVPHIRRAWVVEPSAGSRQIASSEWIVFRSKEADARYLRHFLVSDGFHRQFMQTVSGVGGSLLRARPKYVAKFKIPLPPLEEQRRIAAILDKAHEIQVADRKRRETLGRFQASYFRYLFGEPSKATENWSLTTIASCCKSIQTGPFGSLLHQSDYIQDGIPIVNPKHIINGVVSCGENETITEDKAEELSNYRLEEGDVLLARRGEMGRCAAITRRENGYLCGTGSMFLRPLRDALVPEYLAALLSSKHMRSKLERVAIGTTLLNLNSTIVGDVLIPVPPIELQLRYVRFLARLDAIGDITSRSAFASSAFLASIQNSIFPNVGS